MSIRYRDPSGQLRIKRHYKFVLWSLAIGLLALLVAGILHGQ